MESIAELLFQIFIEFAIAGPGGLILWLLKGRKKRYWDFLNENLMMSALVGIVIWCLVLGPIIVTMKSAAL
jgi:hypothetical protein